MSGLVTTTWPAARMVLRMGAGRVPVVDAGGELQVRERGQFAQLGRLVLAERLGREEVQRAGCGSSAMAWRTGRL